MIPVAVILYGFLLSFVLSAGARNKREGRANPMILTTVGYVLCGMSAGVAAILPIWSWIDPAATSTLLDLI